MSNIEFPTERTVSHTGEVVDIYQDDVYFQNPSRVKSHFLGRDLSGSTPKQHRVDTAAGDDNSSRPIRHIETKLE